MFPVISLKGPAKKNVLSAGMCSDCFSVLEFTDASQTNVQCNGCGTVKPFVNTNKQESNFNQNSFSNLSSQPFSEEEQTEFLKAKEMENSSPLLVGRNAFSSTSSVTSSSSSLTSTSSSLSASASSPFPTVSSSSTALDQRFISLKKDHAHVDATAAGVCKVCLSVLEYTDGTHMYVRCNRCKAVEPAKPTAAEAAAAAAAAAAAEKEKQEKEKVRVKVVCMIAGYNNFDLPLSKTSVVGVLRAKIAKHLKREASTFVLMGIGGQGEYVDDEMSVTQLSVEYGDYKIQLMEKAKTK